MAAYFLLPASSHGSRLFKVSDHRGIIGGAGGIFYQRVGELFSSSTIMAFGIYAIIALRYQGSR